MIDIDPLELAQSVRRHFGNDQLLIHDLQLLKNEQGMYVQGYVKRPDDNREAWAGFSIWLTDLADAAG